MANNTFVFSEHCLRVLSLGDPAMFITYKIITPLHFFAGLFSSFLCLVAFGRKANSETAFTYQIVFTLNQICQNIGYTAYAATFYWWSGAGGPSAEWFQSCYVCMWYTAHLTTPLVNMFMTNSLLLTLATAADRIFAMWKPFVYKDINHKRHQTIACIICAMVSIAINIFACFSLYPADIDGDGLYAIADHGEYTTSLTAIVLSYVRNVVRLAAAILVIVANAFMIYIYRKNMNKVSAIMSSNPGHEKKKRAQQKVLVLLAVFESFFNLLCMGCLFVYYGMYYTIPNFFDCESNLVSSIVDGLIEAFEICAFYVVIAVSQTFRSMIAETMPKWMKRVATLVTN